MIWQYLQKYKKQAILGPIFKVIEAILELLVPFVVASMIDNGIVAGNTAHIYRMGMLLFVLATLGYGSALICQYYASVASQGFGTELREALMKKIMSFSYGESKQFSPSTLITRMTADINQLQLAIAMFIRLASRVPFIIFGAIIAGFVIDVRLALIFIVVTPLLALIIYLIMKTTAPLYQAIQKQLDKLASMVRENMTGVRVIRAFTRREEEKNKWHREVEEQNKLQVKAGKIAALQSPLTIWVVNLGILFILWQSGLRIHIGTLTQGETIAFISYMNQILLALLVLANILVIFNRAAVSSKRVGEVLAVVTEEQVQVAEYGNSQIQVTGLSFRYYEESEYVLKDIDFHVEKGEIIGMIGGTGSGKSTLAQILAGLLPAVEGSVAVKGEVSLVPQKAVLFSGNLRENLLLGGIKATDEELFAALSIAQANFVTDLGSVVVQGGKNFSGGERKRLTIARSLVRNPDILLLDDSFSGLDLVTEAKVREKLRELDKTIILISERIATIQSADRIICLDEGKIAGIGTHHQLLVTSPIYQEIVRSQAGRMAGDYHG